MIEILKDLNVLSLLRYPEEFYGDPQVNYLIKFKDYFVSLIGKSDQKLPEDGVVILEHHFDEARKLMDKINGLSQKVIADSKKYDDKKFCEEYFNLAKAGYEMLNKNGKQDGIPVSLERAGLVTTRLALGLGKDAVIENEQRVVTKRTHLKSEPEKYLSVTVKWREEDKLKQLNGRAILLSDFVNPASGASGLAFILALGKLGIKPKLVNHRSISCTRQGIIIVKKALSEMGIKATFYSVGEADELNEMYYLTGKRSVADAGHLLCHFLPSWYKQ